MADTALYDSRIREALELEIPYLSRQAQEKLLAGRDLSHSVESAVLVILDVIDWRVLLTARTDRVVSHKGQIAFPGGVRDASDADLLQTALRETEEEVGMGRGSFEVLGALPKLTTLSTGFWITPYVARVHSPFEIEQMVPSAEEIAAIFWVPLEELRKPGIYSFETFTRGSAKIPTHVYRMGPHEVWGATAAMLKNLLDRLARVGL